MSLMEQGVCPEHHRDRRSEVCPDNLSGQNTSVYLGSKTLSWLCSDKKTEGFLSNPRTKKEFHFRHLSKSLPNQAPRKSNLRKKIPWALRKHCFSHSAVCSVVEGQKINK